MRRGVTSRSFLLYYPNMDHYLEFAQAIADKAATIAVKHFSFDTEYAWKSDNTPLTEADTGINELVIQSVRESFPDHSVYGEEASSNVEGSRYIWVCDPIDGTMPFSLGLPIFTFSLALVDTSDGQPILGLINDPVQKNMYWATKGGGAFRNGHPIHVSDTESLKNTYISFDGSQDFGIGIDSVATMRSLHKNGARTMKLLSVVYGGVQVANGKFAASLFFGGHGHDVAALKIITEEAGGKATDLLGESRRYDTKGTGFVSTNGILHDEILSLIARA